MHKKMGGLAEGLGDRDGGEHDKGRSPVPWGGGSSDPMIEAGAPSTEVVAMLPIGCVPGPPG
jgi:hypothetical protein